MEIQVHFKYTLTANEDVLVYSYGHSIFSLSTYLYCVVFDFMMFMNKMLHVFSFRNTKMSHHLDDDDDDDENNLWTFIA